MAYIYSRETYETTLTKRSRDEYTCHDPLIFWRWSERYHVVTVARLKGELTSVQDYAFCLWPRIYLPIRVGATALEPSLPNSPVSRYREKWLLCLAHTRTPWYRWTKWVWFVIAKLARKSWNAKRWNCASPVEKIDQNF